MTTVEQIAAFLEDAMRRPEHLARDVDAFLHAVWEAPDRAGGDPRAWDILEDLAYELSHYVADPEIRRTDPTYYGNRRALVVIRSGLERLVRLRRSA